MHELAMEGTFTKVYQHLGDADGLFLSKFTGNYQLSFLKFPFRLKPSAFCLPQKFRYNSIRNLFLYNAMVLN